jgi:hypothetical protein
MFVGVNKLLPGHLLSFEQGEVRVRQHRDIPTRSQNLEVEVRLKSTALEFGTGSGRCSKSRCGCAR